MDQNTTLKITGMTCGGCVRSVTQVLQSLDGVGSVEVSLEQGTAKIVYDDTKLDETALCEAVEEAGFDVA